MKFLSFFFLIIFISTKVTAQQTIFNVPSADVADKNRTFIQHESQFRTKEEGRFWTGTNYVTHGIGYNTELTSTLFNLNSPATKNVTLAAGFKSSIPISIKKISAYKPKIIIGSMIPFSLQGNGVGNWTYISGNFTLPQTSSRITMGISSGSKQIFGENATCFIGGFEQKITNKLSFINDWYSGESALGIFATGISYNFPQDFALFGGYQIPNSKKVGRNSVVIEVAKTF